MSTVDTSQPVPGRGWAGLAAVVTGAAEGIGRATAVAFATAGADVLLVDVDEDPLTAAADAAAAAAAAHGGRALAHVADVSDARAVTGYVARAVDEFGRIDAFFNNAGILGPHTNLAELPVDDFDRVIAVNLRGVFLGLRHVLPIMLGQGAGAVVNTASMGALGAIPGVGAYVASKHAVLGLTRNAALEVAASGVRVNAVLPGNIHTRMGLADRNGTLTSEQRAERERSGAAPVPQGRMGTPEEIAETVLFLCSPAAGHITGTALPVDGGLSVQMYPKRFID